MLIDFFGNLGVDQLDFCGTGFNKRAFFNGNEVKIYTNRKKELWATIFER